MNTLNKIETGFSDLTDKEIIELLNIDTTSNDFYRLLAVSNALSRKKFHDHGYVFAQIGINAEPCSVNCKFCSLAADHYSLDSKWKKDLETLIDEVRRLKNGYNDLFLMTTADYSIYDFLVLGKAVDSIIPKDKKLVANIGDFNFEVAKKLKSVGFTGVYHIVRLREGIDTMATVQDRKKSLDAAVKAGLEIYYCIEPIGPEHTPEELLVEIKRARDLKIDVMAVMRRIAVPGTPLYDRGQISASELTKIAAVTNIVVQPFRSMNVHEPTQMSLLAGVNQLYAEVGANPRDTESKTELNRGFTCNKAWKMLSEAGYYK